MDHYTTYDKIPTPAQKTLNRTLVAMFIGAAIAELFWILIQPWRFLPHGTEFPYLFRGMGVATEYGWYLLVLFGVLPIAWLASLFADRLEALKRRDAFFIALCGGLSVFVGLVLTDWIYLPDRMS